MIIDSPIIVGIIDVPIIDYQIIVTLISFLIIDSPKIVGVIDVPILNIRLSLSLSISDNRWLNRCSDNRLSDNRCHNRCFR